MEDITLLTTIITATDDPIIPVTDFYQFQTNDLTDLIIQPYGGHNEFIDGIYLHRWYDQLMIMIFDEATKDSRISLG